MRSEIQSIGAGSYWNVEDDGGIYTIYPKIDASYPNVVIGDAPGIFNYKFHIKGGGVSYLSGRIVIGDSLRLGANGYLKDSATGDMILWDSFGRYRLQDLTALPTTLNNDWDLTIGSYDIDLRNSDGHGYYTSNSTNQIYFIADVINLSADVTNIDSANVDRLGVGESWIDTVNVDEELRFTARDTATLQTGVIYRDSDDDSLFYRLGSTWVNLTKDESGIDLGSSSNNDILFNNSGVIDGFGSVYSSSVEISKTIFTATEGSYHIEHAPSFGEPVYSFQSHPWVGLNLDGTQTGIRFETYNGASDSSMVLYPDSLWLNVPLKGNHGISGGSPSGNNYQIQFNDNGSFGASANFSWNDTTLNIVSSHGARNILLTPHNIGLTGSYNIMITQLPPSSFSGSSSTVIGDNAGANLTTANFNTFFGADAGKNTNSGGSNVFIGFQSGNGNTSGSSNVGLGISSLYDNSTGDHNVSIGTQSGYNNTSSYNTFVGSASGYGNISGNNNTIIGYGAGFNSTGSGNVLIGFHSGYNVLGSNKLSIDNSSSDIPLIHGNFDIDSLKINGTFIQASGIIIDNDATPDVSGANIWTYNGTSNSVVITDLDNPAVGAIYRIVGNSDTYTITINDGGNFNISGNWTGGVDDVITIYVQADNDYIEFSNRVDN